MIKDYINKLDSKVRWGTAVLFSIAVSWFVFYYLAFSGLVVIIFETIIYYFIFITICHKNGKIPMIIATIPVLFFSLLNISAWHTLDLTPEQQLLINDYGRNVAVGLFIATGLVWRGTNGNQLIKEEKPQIENDIN